MDLSKARWRKSSFSGNNGGDCVEVADLSGRADEWGHEFGPVELIAVRDSKNPDGPKLFFVPDEWAAFLNGVKVGEFERE
ncbi:DUF397 domain-containing protein [Sphaerisporangium sp. NPDC049003]|uniref:DUF397 domain-containing protein n=1 Tax=Sphaerisporangium sp. NPDC049003 TaxID=3364517 RepID=UPI003711A6F5